MKSISLFVLSWALVAFGQPHISAVLSLVSSIFGFGLFWLGLMQIESRKKRYIASTLWFFAVQLVQLSWLASPTFQGFYIYFVYGALALWLGVEFGVLSFFLPKKGPLSYRKILGISALWTLLEWSRLFVLCGFAWNPIGLSLTGVTVSGQFASIVGVFGLSFMVMATNLFGVNLILKKTIKSFVAFAAFALFPYAFGVLYMKLNQKTKSHAPYHVALVQTALLPDEKDYFYGKEEKFVHPYKQWHLIVSYLKEHSSKNLDLIVLPEYALPFGSYSCVYPFEDMASFMEKELGDLKRLLIFPFAEEREGKWYVSNAFWAQAIADYYESELVLGLDSKDDRAHYNAAFHFSPFGKKVISRYEKRVLLPLAEYLPFSFLKPLVARYGITGFFTHGKEAKVVGEKHPMSLSVCYEECFPHIIREGRIKGAKLFVNVTNDGWYPYSKLPEQHFIHGRIRAIENGAPLLRACNTGVTAGVDRFGRTVAKFVDHEGRFELKKGALFVHMDLSSHQTLYTFWGDGCIVLVSSLFLAFLFSFRNEKKKR